MKSEYLCDLHCHILPGVDDGAKSMEMAMQMLEKEKLDGVERIVLTPHYRRGMFETEMGVITHQFERLQALTKESGGPELALGCEFHSNMDMEEMLDRDFRPTLAGTKCVLVEFSSEHTFTYMRERCRTLRRRGYQPLIAHIERYPVLRKNMKNLEQLVQEGAYTQMNAQSILGQEGWMTSRYCHKAIHAGLIHVVASDAHDMKLRKPQMGECYNLLRKKHGIAKAEELMSDFPNDLLGAW